MHRRLFDTYVIVDWSGAGAPCRGTNSIWIAAFAWRRRMLKRSWLENLPTRSAATESLMQRLTVWSQQGRRTLVGFDFAFGYPRGTAARLGFGGPPWRSLWEALAAAIRDAPDNSNNRFDVAEDWNRRISGTAYPFWGLVRNQTRPLLAACKPPAFAMLPERRLCDLRRAQPVWKLAYPGSVGSQSLTGIPRVWALRTSPGLADSAAIWPFESGLADAADKAVIFAEIYPSLVPAEKLADLPKDAGQVIAFGKFLAMCDAAGGLSDLFAGDASLNTEERLAVIGEEGWILGMRDRQGIY
jgi:precorrin-8X/cobalt-precorrin-8 methylmutase